MRAVFGVVSLLVVLAIVGLLASRQLRAVAPAPASAASGPSARSSPAQVQQQITQDLGKALEQGAATRREAEEK